MTARPLLDGPTDPAPVPPLVEPRQHARDDDPRTCALYDRAWDANDYDIHRDED
ncbi:hypothetical protein ABT186_02000 [Streptomyces sp. NPDC001634]|uniref:hypothetical protein n=1 Tax=Streptomyces sp. NPDC001634 TaxID=3154390 RepID=UPI00331C1403